MFVANIGATLAAVNIPADSNQPKPATSAGFPACFQTERGLEFAFAELHTSLVQAHSDESDEGDFVLWRRKPNPAAAPLSGTYGGRHGKVTGRIRSLGEYWLTAILDDCSAVYAMDTSMHSAEGPLMHLQSVGRIYYVSHLQFARSLQGRFLRVRHEGLEPYQRLYDPEGKGQYPLLRHDLLQVIGVETRRYGYTKGIGGFYVRVRNERGQTGLIKFHQDYLMGENGESLWSVSVQGAADQSVFVSYPEKVYAAE